MRVLIVCSGNTCRSPMAEIMLREELSRAGILDVEVFSAGLVSPGGEAMSPNSSKALVMGGYGDGAEFRSSAIDKRIPSDFDLILCMTHSHETFLVNRFPETNEKTRVLDISDPFGEALETYLNTFEEIKKAVSQLVVELKEGKQKGVK